MDLVSIVSAIEDNLKENKDLDLKLHLGSKFRGIAGEAIALAKLFQIYGESAHYLWYGKFKKDYDVIVSHNGAAIKVQIKSSSDEDFLFRVLTVSFENPSEVISRIQAGNLNDVFKAIDKEVDGKDVTYWLLVHLRKDRNDFYKLSKDKMKQVVKKHYENYYHSKHREKTNFAINPARGIYMPMLTQKRKTDVELLSNFTI